MKFLFLLTFFFLPSLLFAQTFDEVKYKIAEYESSNGQFKVNCNSNKTVDCGLYQINSYHFHFSLKKISKKEIRIRKEFNKIFDAYKVSNKLHDRVVAAIQNDKLNEELARALYNISGLKAWAVAPIIKKNIKNPKQKARD